MRDHLAQDASRTVVGNLGVRGLRQSELGTGPLNLKDRSRSVLWERNPPICSMGAPGGVSNGRY